MRSIKTIKIPIFTFWGVLGNQEIQQRSCFLISCCLFPHKNSYFSWLGLHPAQPPYARNETCEYFLSSLLMNCSLANWSGLLDGRGGLFEDFVEYILLNNYFPGFWMWFCVWLIFLAVIQAVAFPSHVDLVSAMNKLTLSWDIFHLYCLGNQGG